MRGRVSERVSESALANSNKQQQHFCFPFGFCEKNIKNRSINILGATQDLKVADVYKKSL
jgi:hypothetical protein